MIIYRLDNLIPLTYLLKTLRGIVLKSLGFRDLWVETAALFVIVSITKFRKPPG